MIESSDKKKVKKIFKTIGLELKSRIFVEKEGQNQSEV